MKNSISLPDIGKQLAKFFSRYGLIAFVLITLAGLIVAVILLNNVIAKTDDTDGYISTTNNITFDEDTIKKVEALRQDGEDTNAINPGGRLLPF